MEERLIQINKTNYIVSNHKGELNLIKNNTNIEEIFMKENKIEDTYDNLFYKKDLLDIIKNKDKMRKDLNKAFIIIGIISAITGYFTPIGLVTMFAIMTPSIFCFKLLFSLISGTKKSNQREITSLNSSIESDNQKIKILTKELEELKTKSNYQILPYSETHINPMNQSDNEHNQYKVKRLVPNKEK